MRCSVAAFLWAALTPGCTVATAPSSGVRVETLGTVFEREARGLPARVAFSVTNTGARSVFLARCGKRVMATVDRPADARWVQYSGDACLTIFPMVPVELPPGSRLDGVRTVGEPGRYRLRLGVASGAGEPTEWAATSGPFEVR